ncbi:MAG: crossover junction endodeoxyribonuclease RuvC [Deltaproteobacteria bacterium]|nr:crossover junction endodeoxyribonuclease RuvC [Deltaproteobacteria bacterium]MBW2648340.1 crossover junction endodeoxyribonuclease RuvC [Deltaproteobacteria bacterium]
MIILGIDPGTKTTGYGVVEKGERSILNVAYGEIRMRRGEPLSSCLKKIYDQLIEIIREYAPDAVALEDIFYGKNVKSLIKLAQARGVIILAASHSSIPLYEYTPLEVKKAIVGYGRAEKIQVQHMVRVILSLKETPPLDASDALAIAICHSNFLKEVPV